jgi:hypothetical protein
VFIAGHSALWVLGSNEVVPMEAPEVHILIKQSWQLFGTFTFRQEEMSTGRPFNMFFAWLRNFGTLDNDYGHSDKNWPAAKILTSSDLLKPADVKRSFNKISI